MTNTEVYRSLAGSTSSSGFVMCWGAAGIHHLIEKECETCEKETTFVERWDGAWYGTTMFCTVCLDSWQDGFLLPRREPKNPEYSIANTVAKLVDTALSDEEYLQWTSLDVHRATCQAEGPCAECKYEDG